MTRLAVAARAVPAALVLAALAAFVATLPPRAMPPPGGRRSPPHGQVRGLIHLHTQRSDGSGTLDEVARAASQAGLDFIVVTDHGNGMSLQPPTYRAGVLCIDAAEVSTTDGHLVAVGLAPTPFPLAGEGRDVVQDVHRFGGVAFAAHPTSPKEALAWRGWEVPIDGFEWLNADSEWRDVGRLALARTVAHYIARGPESIAAIFDRPAALFARWDQTSREGRALAAYGAADAHARLGPDAESRDEDDERPGWALRLPSYETMFRVLSVHVELDRPFGGRAVDDAAVLLDALRVGRAYTVIDAFAEGGALEFQGETTAGPVRMGGVVEAGGLTRLRVRAHAPPTTTLRLLRNGEVVAKTTGVSLEVGPGELKPLAPGERAAAYRVDAYIGAQDATRGAPWVVSNPIFEGSAQRARPLSTEDPWAGDAQRSTEQGARLVPSGEWGVEKDGLSQGRLAWRPDAGSAQLDFVLGPGRGPRWVAVAIPLADRAAAGLADRGSVVAGLRSSAPMRASIQLRAASETRDLRWVRSVFADDTTRWVAVPLSSMLPVGPAAAAASIESARSLLLVVDQTNTLPGTRGSLWIEGVTLVGRKELGARSGR